jgi:hypothetical protein
MAQAAAAVPERKRPWWLAWWPSHGHGGNDNDSGGRAAS